jgi:hypothetical protein
MPRQGVRCCHGSARDSPAPPKGCSTRGEAARVLALKSFAHPPVEARPEGTRPLCGSHSPVDLDRPRRPELIKRETILAHHAARKGDGEGAGAERGRPCSGRLTPAKTRDLVSGTDSRVGVPRLCAPLFPNPHTRSGRESDGHIRTYSSLRGSRKLGRSVAVFRSRALSAGHS